MAVKKKTVKKKKPVEPEKIEINLRNIFPYMVSETSAQSKLLQDLHRKIDRLQMTVDAVGLAVVETKNGR